MRALTGRGDQGHMVKEVAKTVMEEVEMVVEVMGVMK